MVGEDRVGVWSLLLLLSMEKEKFNEMMRQRTKQLAVRVIKFYGKLPKSDATRVIGRQLIRASTSTAANYRAVCRARSKAEFFAKLSITVGEADESVFWLDILQEADLVPYHLSAELPTLHQEATEVLAIFATARKNTK